MTRVLIAAALAAGVATAAPVPKTAPAPSPKAGATAQLGTAQISGEMIQITQTVDVTSYTAVQVVKQVNGQPVVINKAEPQTRQVTRTMRMPLQGAKATTADNKELSQEELAKRLADPTAVVQVPADFDPEWKKLFADDVIFLQTTGASTGGFGGAVGRPRVILPALPIAPGGGVAPVPVPVPVPKGGIQIEILPAIEKK